MLKSLLVAALAAATTTAAPPAPGHEYYRLLPAANQTLGLRHYQYIAFTTPVAGDPVPFDFYFAYVQGMSGQQDEISFQSRDFPELFLGLSGGSHGEIGRLGLTSAYPYPYDVSFRVKESPNNANFSVIASSSLNSTFNGLYMRRAPNNATMNGGNPSWTAGFDVYLDKYPPSNPADSVYFDWNITAGAGPGPAPYVLIDATNVTHQVSPWLLGCHSDSGYTHQPRGFYAQLIYGAAFEPIASAAWSNNVTTPGVQSQSKIDTSIQFNTRPSWQLQFESGTGTVGIANRGFGNTGLVLEARKQYEGYILLHNPTNSNVNVTVGVRNFLTNQILDSVTFTIKPSHKGEFIKSDFIMLPNAATTCGAAPITSGINCGNLPSPGHICIQCGGEFAIWLTEADTTINIGYSYLQPGAWGRVGDLPVLASAAQMLQDMGTNILRQGGTFAQGMRWKEWRGDPLQRPSMGHTWGASLISGWGPFEMVDLLNYLDIEPVLTLAKEQSVQDWADLIEYCWGDASTQWGKIRHDDGHPDPYRVRIFELGNEEENPNFLYQVTAMAAKAKEVNLPQPILWMYPTNDGVNETIATLLTQAGINPADILIDIHIGGGGAVEVAERDFARIPTFMQSAINAETNAGTNDLGRALSEGSDLNDWMNTAPPIVGRMVARTASFCNERSGFFDGFDQGLSFFLQNMTWLQPPGYVHKMTSKTLGSNSDPQLNALFINHTNPMPQAIASNLLSMDGKKAAAIYESRGATRAAQRARGLSDSNMISISAQAHPDGSSIIVRGVNLDGQPLSFFPVFNGVTVGSDVTLISLSAEDAGASNTPAQPELVSPVETKVAYSNGAALTMDAFSVNIWVFAVSKE